MIISISSDAEADLAEGFCFYQRQAPGLGDDFRSCLISDIESLSYYAGVHQIINGYLLRSCAESLNVNWIVLISLFYCPCAHKITPVFLCFLEA